MCGFVGMFDVKGDTAQYRTKVLDMSRKIRHRGPDWSGIYTGPSAIIGHERLAIVDPLSGKQPLYSKDGKLVLAVNGEIYNHRELRLLYDGYHGRPAYEFLTNSDCEIILALYRDKGCALFEELNGIFALPSTMSSRMHISSVVTISVSSRCIKDGMARVIIMLPVS
jgi:asparagine synthase (glutamine-hydrolysing)